MALGYGGTYWGSVVDDADPLGEDRLQVLVPEIYGSDAPVWAKPSVAPGGGHDGLPGVGDTVSVSFEGGDSDYPVWERGAPTAVDEAPAQTGHIGKYRGVVVDNVDPLSEYRLKVQVPEVLDTEESWARASLPDEADMEVPDVGAEVWIEFENGDALYPIWVGVP
jgi:uncharacterized protein involved in type VI secretion and phage assembly